MDAKVKISRDKPMNPNTSLNIERPAVLCQYFCKKCDQTVNISSRSEHRYIYGSISEISSVGIGQ